MARKKRDAHLMELARRGAEARLDDLVHEMKMLVDLFPHLRDSFDKDELPLKFIIRKGRDQADATQRRRTPMSAAARKVVSARMKKYWAKRRTEAGGK